MDYFYTGKIFCKQCQKELSWFCSAIPPRAEYISFPTGVQMFHSRTNGRDSFTGLCDRNHKLTLPDEVVENIPEQYYVNP